MKKTLLSFLLTCTLYSGITEAQPWYARGTFNGWAGTAEQLVDDGTNGDVTAGDGIFSRMISIPAAGRYEFKVTVDDWSVNFPSSNSWFVTTVSNQSILITFNTNTLTDGWLPNTNIINISDQLPPVSNIVAVGDHNGWNNSGSEVMYDNGLNGDPVAGDNIFTYHHIAPAPGTFNWKATLTGTWDAWGSDNRSINSSNLSYTTTSANQDVFFYLDLNTGRSFTTFTPLPVELVSFSFVTSGAGITLNWVTATELNNMGFGVERSTDGSVFSEITFVPGYGTSLEPRNYSYTDSEITTGIYFYRLRQVDYDGTIDYSDILKVDYSFIPDILTLDQNYPNPFNPQTKIKFTASGSENAVLNVYNTQGELVRELFSGRTEAGKVYEFTFSSEGLTSGVYFYKLVQGSEMQTRKMLLLK